MRSAAPRAGFGGQASRTGDGQGGRTESESPSRARYREHIPHPALREHVECYWTLRGRVRRGEERVEAVVPDACVDFLFDLSAGTAQLVGTMTRPLPVLRAGSMDLLGVRFRPGALTTFVDAPAAEITDADVPLLDAAGPAGAELFERLEEEPHTPDRIAVLDRCLSLDWKRPPRGGDELVLAAARVLAERGGNVRVPVLAAAVGLGRRQLERRFLDAVGLSPKRAARVLRFQTALSRLLGRPADSLAAVAVGAGYHDQAHFTRDFAELAGETPGAYRARRAAERARTGTGRRPADLRPDDAFLQDRDAAPA